MATELKDTDLLAKLAGGDMVAIEAKYHTNCMVSLRNRCRSFVRSSSTDETPDTQNEIAKARAFAEILSYMANCCEAGEYIFKLSNLHQICTSRLCELNNELFLMTRISKTKIQQSHRHALRLLSLYILI